MKNIVIFYLISIFIFLFPSISFSQEIVPEYKLDLKIHEIDAKEYLCFDKESSKLLLQLRLDIPKLQEQVKGLKILVELQDKEIILFNDINTNFKQQVKFLADQNISLQKQLDERDSWWKSPYLWFGIGVLIGVGGTVLVIEVVK